MGRNTHHTHPAGEVRQLGWGVGERNKWGEDGKNREKHNV